MATSQSKCHSAVIKVPSLFRAHAIDVSRHTGVPTSPTQDNHQQRKGEYSSNQSGHVLQQEGDSVSSSIEQ